jgi:hypothetical protein
VIDTDRPIRGAIAAPTSGGAGFTVAWHTAIVAPIGREPIWLLTDAGLCFTAPSIARFLCTDVSIEVTPFDCATCDGIDALLVATALPAAMWLDGAFVLHAATIVPPGACAALAIAGSSGSGKSRLAARFIARGAAFVGDDSIAIRWPAGRPTCAGLAGGYHLGVPDDGDRPFHSLPPDRGREQAPLAAIAILSDCPEPRRLTGVDAVQALLANRHRPGAVRHACRERHALDDAAQLARTVAVFRWPRVHADRLLDKKSYQAMMHEGGER